MDNIFMHTIKSLAFARYIWKKMPAVSITKVIARTLEGFLSIR